MAVNQKITGRVIDSTTSKGLDGVSVSLDKFRVTTKTEVTILYI